MFGAVPSRPCTEPAPNMSETPENVESAVSEVGRVRLGGDGGAGSDPSMDLEIGAGARVPKVVGENCGIITGTGASANDPKSPKSSSAVVLLALVSSSSPTFPTTPEKEVKSSNVAIADILEDGFVSTGGGNVAAYIGRSGDAVRVELAGGEIGVIGGASIGTLGALATEGDVVRLPIDVIPIPSLAEVGDAAGGALGGGASVGGRGPPKTGWLFIIASRPPISGADELGALLRRSSAAEGVMSPSMSKSLVDKASELRFRVGCREKRPRKRDTAEGAGAS
jgi:hypothetical protein